MFMKDAEAIDWAIRCQRTLSLLPWNFANYYSAPKKHKRKYGGKERYLNKQLLPMTGRHFYKVFSPLNVSPSR